MFTIRQLITKSFKIHQLKSVRQTSCHRCIEFGTMEELPVPCGCFKDLYAKRNLKYNIILGLGVITIIPAIGLFFSKFTSAYFRAPCNIDGINEDTKLSSKQQRDKDDLDARIQAAIDEAKSSLPK